MHYRGRGQQYLFLLLVCGLFYFGAGLNSHAVIASPNESSQSNLYPYCASCHLPDGAGVPYAFPPFANHLEKFFATQIGRDYIMQTVISGISGEIEVDGITYYGYMPPVTEGTDEADDASIVALLNDLVQRFGSEAQRKQLPLFDSRDISRIRQAAPKDESDILSMREAALEAAMERE